jgi:hypothetical protein
VVTAALPLVIKVCKQRGLNYARRLSITDISAELGVFDTILMLGNNFSLFGSPEKAKKLLRKFLGVTSEQGQIIAQTRDPYQTKMLEHLEYHEMNRKQGKMAGQAKIRIRYKKYATPWFDFFMVSKEEMQGLLRGTGWKVQRFIDGQNGIFAAIIGKT